MFHNFLCNSLFSNLRFIVIYNKMTKSIGILVLSITFQVSGITLSATPRVFGKHHFGIYPGISIEYNRDKQASLLRYSGRDFPYRIFYSYMGIKNQHNLDLIYKRFSPKSSAGNKADFVKVDLRYSYLRFNSSIFSDKVNIFIGVVWTYSFSARVYNFYSFYNEGQFGVAFSSLSPAFLGEQKLSDSKRLYYKISSPLLTYIIRSGYSYPTPDKLMDRNLSDVTFIDVLKSGNFVTLNQFRGLTAFVKYQEVVSKHLTLNVGYEFDYYHYSYGFSTTSANHQIFFSLSWMF